MTVRLFAQATVKFLLGLVLVGILVFLPAGTLNYPCGILFITLLFVPMFIAGIVMLFKSPELLKSRLTAKEKQKEQSAVIKLSGLMFLAGFVTAGLDYRFGWSDLPEGVIISASVLFVLAYIIYAEVLRENAYLSRVIEVRDGQKVIDSGLYGIVRHPMYGATLILFLSMPIVLGSIYAFFIFLAYPPIIIVRLLNEEKLLEKELEGYAEYKKRVRFRLIPFIW